MLKLSGRLCFLVLAISSISRGQNETAVSPDPVLSSATPPLLLDSTQNEATQSSPSSTADVLSTTFTSPEEGTLSTEDLANKTTAQVTDSSAAPTLVAATLRGGDANVDMVLTVSTTTASSTSAQPGTGHSGWGYVLLLLIILVIVILCVILYFLRRVSRTYSFDLHRQVPSNHRNEHIGTFEAVYLDDMDRPAPKGQETPDDLSPPPVSNGTTLQMEEPASNGESAPQEQPDTNGVQTPPPSNTSPSLGDDPADKTSSPLSSTDLFFDAIGEEQQNENNNNPSVCSTDPFVEINLEEAPWCDQLFTSIEAPSSVLPFSPFSFSSSSSS